MIAERADQEGNAERALPAEGDRRPQKEKNFEKSKIAEGHRKGFLVRARRQKPLLPP